MKIVMVNLIRRDVLEQLIAVELMHSSILQFEAVAIEAFSYR